MSKESFFDHQLFQYDSGLPTAQLDESKMANVAQFSCTGV